MSYKTFFVVAFKAEISFLIDRLKLKKKEDSFFKIYENENYKVIISGKGEINSAIASTYLSKVYDIDKNDKIINFGTCASKNAKVGEVVEFGQIVNIATNQKFILNKAKEKIFCSSKEILHSNHKYGFVDMESAGFYIAAKKFFNHIQVIKVVSDNFNKYEVVDLDIFLNKIEI